MARPQRMQAELLNKEYNQHSQELQIRFKSEDLQSCSWIRQLALGGFARRELFFLGRFGLIDRQHEEDTWELLLELEFGFDLGSFSWSWVADTACWGGMEDCDHNGH